MGDLTAVEQYEVTPAAFKALQRAIKANEEARRRASQDRASFPSPQIGRDAGGFLSCGGGEFVAVKRVDDLREILDHCVIAEIKEQSSTVQIGNGVVVKYPDGLTRKFVLDGFVFNSPVVERVSVNSPLGQAILGAKIGETRFFDVNEKTLQITITNIIPPSKAEKVLFPRSQKK